METTYIYTLSDPRTNEIRYVGKTNNPAQRLKAHMNNCRDKGTHKRNWIQSLRCLGLKPILEIIDEVPIESWQFWEQWWYQILKGWGFRLVNSTIGGDGLTFGNNTSFKKGHNCKSISAFDKTGQLVKQYKSIIEACEDLDIDSGHLCKVLKGHGKTAKSYAWFYSDSIPSKDEILSKFKRVKTVNSGCFKRETIPWNKGKSYSKRGSRRVMQYSLDDILLNVFDSCAQAASAIGGNQDAISACCRGTSKTSKGFKWKYEQL